jgi:transcription elongation GreA/GreB family factor
LNEKLAICWSQINSLKVKLAKNSQENDKIIIYCLLKTGEEKTVELTDGEIDPDQGKISATSPLGAALNDKKVGEISEVKANPPYKVKIISINKK